MAHTNLKHLRKVSNLLRDCTFGTFRDSAPRSLKLEAWTPSFAKIVSVISHMEEAEESWHSTVHTLQITAHFTVYSAHCTLNTAQCTLHTKYCTLLCTVHSAHYILQSHCALHSSHYTLYISLHIGQCKLKTSQGTVHRTLGQGVTVPV